MTAHQVHCDGASVSDDDGARTRDALRSGHGRLGTHWSAWFGGCPSPPARTAPPSCPAPWRPGGAAACSRSCDLGVPLLELGGPIRRRPAPGPTPKDALT